MAQDFAKKRGSSAERKKPASRKNPASNKSNRSKASPGRGWRWYGAGVITGVFLSFLVYLGAQPSPSGTQGLTAGADDKDTDKVETAPEPRFDFYRLLPEQSIEVEAESAEPAEMTPTPTPAAAEFYLLQAGSFRQREDADRRRAELLLLGLEPRVEEASGDNGRWFRVYLGPFDTRSAMSRARSLTAGQDIDTLLLKRGQP